MNRRSACFAFAPLFAAAASLLASNAFANGRFPAADQLIIDPVDPTHIVVRTTFGFMETRDNAKTWLWTCESIIGKIANQDPPFTVTADGSVIVAVPFEGVSITHDHGCTWAKAPDPLMGQLAVDVTLEPNDPAALVVLTSTNDTNPDAGPNAPSEFLNLIVETKDNGVTWARRGVPLPRDFIAATVEIAPSNPQRIYASGVVGDPLTGALERSEDGGNTWTRVSVPSPAMLSSVYISAVHPTDPDRLYIRVLEVANIATNSSPTTLYETRDKGSTWKELAHTTESMLGFALSPDGSKIAYGTLGDGVFLAPTDGSAPFAKVGDIQNRCLTWSPAGLYACNTDFMSDPTLGPGSFTTATNFAVGLSHDMGATYETLYRLSQTCPTTCPDDSRFNQVCRDVWQMQPGVTTVTHATGATCTVPWAHMDIPDAGMSIDAGRAEGGTNPTDASTTNEPPVPPSDSCSCRIGRDAHGTFGARGAYGLAALGLLSRRRRRRRNARS